MTLRLWLFDYLFLINQTVSEYTWEYYYDYARMYGTISKRVLNQIS